MKVRNETLRRFLKLKNEQNARKLKSLLTPFIDFLESKGKELEDFDSYDVIEYLEEEEYKYFVESDELSTSTKKQIYDACVNFMNWYIIEPAENFQEFHNRRSKLKRLKNEVKKKIKTVPKDITERKWLKIKELEELLSFARDKVEGKRDFNIIYLLAYFGFRRKELFNRDELWKELDLSGNHLRLIREKSRQVCVLYFDEQTKEILSESLDRGFLDKEWKHYEYKKYKDLFDEVDFIPHVLRYTFNHHQKKVIRKLVMNEELEQDEDLLMKAICGWTIGQEMGEYYDSATKEAIRKVMVENHYLNQLELV